MRKCCREEEKKNVSKVNTTKFPNTSDEYLAQSHPIEPVVAPPLKSYFHLSQYYPVFNHRHRLTDDWLFICHSVYILRYRARYLLVVDCTIWEQLNWKRNYHLKTISWIEICLNSRKISILLLTAPLIMISLCILIAPLNPFFCHFISVFQYASSEWYNFCLLVLHPESTSLINRATSPLHRNQQTE